MRGRGYQKYPVSKRESVAALKFYSLASNKFDAATAIKSPRKKENPPELKPERHLVGRRESV